MPEVIGHAPLLLTLLMGNNNNNLQAQAGTVVVHEQIAEADYLRGLLLNNQNAKNGGLVNAGTVVVHEQVAEADYLRDLTGVSHDNNNKATAIPGTVGVHDQVTEADYLHDPMVGSYDNNNKSTAIPGTIGGHEQATEADYLHGKANGSGEAGFLRLRGESPPAQVLTPAQCESYNKIGYLVIPDALTAAEAAELLGEGRDVMKRISEGGERITRHDITRGVKGPSPIGRILATFEPEDTTVSNPFERRIARLGCGVHQKLPTFRTLTHSPFNRSIAASLNYSNPCITQSQVIAKLACIGGEIVPHQDGCVSFTNPPSALTFWYALEDTTIENGCLCVAGGSHLKEPLRQRLTKEDDGLPKFQNLEVPLWVKGAHNPGVDAGRTEYEYETLEVKKGTLVLFHGNVMHKSATNKSEKNRIAYTFSIIEGDLECPDDSYMKPAEGSFERL